MTFNSPRRLRKAQPFYFRLNARLRRSAPGASFAKVVSAASSRHGGRGLDVRRGSANQRVSI